MSIAIVNGSECYVPFSCLDVNGNPFTPTSIAYQVQNATQNVVVVPETSFPAAQTGFITLSSTVNTMNVLNKVSENRVVTVKIGIPNGSYQNLATTYTLLNYPGTP